ncbi:MAG: DUF4918 family protein [Gemmatimonadaceae bacterium]|nr:DUF4918 family protein [Gemmatimonadaceae bacterium]
MSTFASRAYRFYTRLTPPRVPAGVEVMNPYQDRVARGYARQFLDRYFDDDDPRVLMLGINPGRFGAGITGVTFTDPIALADALGVENHLPRRHELSSVFVYRMIEAFGGPHAFYRRFFLTALSPLGYTKGGKNLNYYDGGLLPHVTPFIVRSIEQQLAMGGRRDHAVVLGTGQNTDVLQRLNDRHGFFERIHAVEHPRFIMQYRRKRLDEFVARYLEACAAALTG